MAIRLNYTGRKKINRQDARFRLRPDGGEMAFDAELHLDGCKIDEPDARVWVEAYHRTSLMRFDFGRLGLILPQAERRLSLFPDSNVVLFRVKVTSEAGEKGKLLAEADGIKPRRPDESGDQRTPLLPIRQGLIQNEVWRVDYTGEGESPELVINSGVEDWKALARDARFHPAVAPAAMRAILTRLAMFERAAHIEEEDHWHNRWWRFATALPGVNADFVIEPATDLDDIGQWIDEAVAAFARQSNALETFLRASGSATGAKERQS